MGSRAIYLITDFGESPYAGILRSVAKSIADVDVIDIDHSVPSFKVLAGAYVLANTYYWARKGSIIVVVVDPGVGTHREALLVEAGDYVLVGPNNGVLYPVIMKEGFKRGFSLIPERVVEVASQYFKGKLPGGKWTLSSTFHGRDVFVPAATLYAFGVQPELFGTPIDQSALKRLLLEYIEEVEEGYRVKTVYIDKFGNIALSVKPSLLPVTSWRRVMVRTDAGTYSVKVGRKFEDVQVGELVMYVNSFGYVEIAVNQGNAAKKLRVSIGDPVVITPLE
ncbi:MAG: SAM-dependent chlorinase/fluorinase [Desulfurococcales archaeon]|nr:SAM-dependent chlorinase/fluorinase [Desulfurococcales archaeon]